MLKLYYHVPGFQVAIWPPELRAFCDAIEDQFELATHCWRGVRYGNDYQLHFMRGGGLSYIYWDCPYEEQMGRYHRMRVTARTPAAELWLMLNAPTAYQVGGPRENARIHDGGAG